jgi:N-acetylmuramoyl-L-alanine amidase
MICSNQFIPNKLQDRFFLLTRLTVLLVFLIAVSPFCLESQNVFSQDRGVVNVFGPHQGEISLTVMKKYDLEFARVGDLSDLLQLRTYYNNLAKKIVVYLGSHKVKITAINPFVMIDDKIYQMPISTEFDEDGIWVPLRYFVDLIAPFSPLPLSYDQDSATLSLVMEGTNIHSIAAEEKVNGFLIRVATLRRFQKSELAVRLSQGWLYLDVYGGLVDTTRLKIAGNTKLIKKMVPVQFQESAQLSFRLAKTVEKEDISTTSSENEILLSVRTSEKIPEDLIADLAAEREKWLIDKIIIDPGHGGKDPGTIGYGGLKEKDVVLDVAKRLKALLEKKLGVDVLMTREKDTFVELRERSAFSNRQGGKLFIGIHANSARSRVASGLETYILGTARTEEDRAIAEKENSVVQYEESWAPYADLSNENSILRTMAQSSFEKESQELAAKVQSFVGKDLGTKDRGVKQAGFLVLVGTAMPKIYIEVGFITNRREAKRLRDKKYRQKVAETIYKGVKEFKENSENVIYEAAKHSANK